MEDATREYACTLDAEGARRRLPQASALTARLRRRERVDDRLVLTLEDVEGTVELVEEFVRDESRCCSFFGFEVRRSEEGIVLELSAPPAASHMLDAAMESLAPDTTDPERLALHRSHADRGIVDAGS